MTTLPGINPDGSVSAMRRFDETPAMRYGDESVLIRALFANQRHLLAVVRVLAGDPTAGPVARRLDACDQAARLIEGMLGRVGEEAAPEGEEAESMDVWEGEGGACANVPTDPAKSTLGTL